MRQLRTMVRTTRRPCAPDTKHSSSRSRTHFRDNFRKVLETGRPVPVPDFLWPMLASLKIPTLVIRGSQSNMFDAATLTKVKEVAPLTQTFELQGSHDLAGDNPAGLTKALSEFLVGGRL
jgi:pimeloyl-ACP methyl ester carboxylesterase